MECVGPAIWGWLKLFEFALTKDFRAATPPLQHLWTRRCYDASLTAKFAIKNIKTEADLEKDLSRLGAACRTIVNLLGADMSGGCQIEAMLSDAWRGSRLPELVKERRF